MKVKPATETDLDEIFMMGFDVWAEGLSKVEYLKSCHESPKYKKGKFIVLEMNGSLLASLIIYNLNSNTYGIGSIAVAHENRTKGFGSKLIRKVVEDLESKDRATSIFLYSDINHKFYEKFGFKAIAKDLQKYDSSVCMLRSSSIIDYTEDANKFIPIYF